MSKVRLSKLDLTGFRSFGRAPQSFGLPDTIAVIWGGNSQGKTSLAEAVEFLFSGQIVRRDLLASAKDEFAEALRNAHIESTAPTRVEADILCLDGKVRRLSRTLVEDYKRGSAAGCVSALAIDGATAAEADIVNILGVTLSQAPLIAPVLTQHTLAYIFSAPPTERSTYFRALLDTQDLEDFRVAVSKVAEGIPAPKHEFLDHLADIEKVAALKPSLTKLSKARTEADCAKHLSDALGIMLKAANITPAGDLEADTELFRAELSRRRSQTFPLGLLSRGKPISLMPLTDEEFGKLTSLPVERERTDADAKRHLALFSAALEIHDHDKEDADCPLCGTADALTPVRLEFISAQVRAAGGYKEAREEAEAVLRALQAQASLAASAVRQALPEFLRINQEERERRGFSRSRIEKLVANEGLVAAWEKEIWRRARIVLPLGRTYKDIVAACDAALGDLDAWGDATALKPLLEKAAGLERQLSDNEPVYLAAAGAMYTPLKEAVDQSTATQGWEALLACAGSPASTLEGIVLDRQHTDLLKALKQAHDQIDKGNGKVADEKFVELSGDVRLWWDRLRPDEPTFFDGVRRRSATARRTVDLRVGLAANEDRSDAKFRDAVAVLSQSQLHCLGLSLFLARAVKEGTGFVVLDDPVLTSDDDFRPNFATSVIEGLLDAGIQVVVATQDHKTWKDIGARWEYRGVAQLQLVRNNPLDGTEVRNENDDLATMIAR